MGAISAGVLCSSFSDLLYLSDPVQRDSSFSLESSSPESAMLSELHLRTVPSKEEETAGPPVASVLQAFAVLGELHTKFKSFGKMDAKNHIAVLV